MGPIFVSSSLFKNILVSFGHFLAKIFLILYTLSWYFTTEVILLCTSENQSFYKDPLRFFYQEIFSNTFFSNQNAQKYLMDSWIWNTAPQRFHLALFGKILWIDRSKIKFANGFLLIHFIITKTGNKVFASKNNSFTMHNGLNWIKFLDKGAFYLHLHCICTANHWKTQMHQNIIRIWKEWRHFIVPSTDNRYGIYQFSFRWIDYSFHIECSGQKTGKSHICALRRIQHC